MADVINHYDWTYDNINRLTDEVFTTNLDNVLDGQTAIGLPTTLSLPDSSRPMRDYKDHYDFDLTGNRLTKTIDLANNGSINSRVTSTFDANDRLLREALDSDGNGSTDRSMLYGYDQTQQTQKTVAIGNFASLAAVPLSSRLSSLTFSYDLQGRSEIATSTTFTNGVRSHVEETTYDYAPTGIRVTATTRIDETGNGTFDRTERVEWLNDPMNFTGYSQVIRETHTDGSANLTKAVSYTFGHDEISQTTVTYANGQPGTPNTLFFSHDGHGSVRALLDAAAAIATIAGTRQFFTYDAYGIAVGFNMSTAATVLLYSGEQFDQRSQTQYLRDRPYDFLTGRLITSDRFFGNLDDPQSFHKYAYTHGDPILHVDPTGYFEGSLATISVGTTLSTGFSVAATGMLLSSLHQNVLVPTLRTAELRRVATQLNTQLMTKADLEKMPVVLPMFRFFVHGTSTFKFAADVTAFDPFAGKKRLDFGWGLYTFEATPAGVFWASRWARGGAGNFVDQLIGSNDDNFDSATNVFNAWLNVPFMFVFRISTNTFDGLHKLTYDRNNPAELAAWATAVNLWRGGPPQSPLSGYDVVIGPVAKEFNNVYTLHPNINIDQFKWEQYIPKLIGIVPVISDVSNA